MKVIDLLNKIANGEELPDAISFNDIIYKKADIGEDYYNFTIKEWFFKDVFDASGVNFEVEIIEEENKLEKLKDILRIDDLEPPFDGNLEMIWKQTIKNQNKINEIIDKLNELGDKE